MRGFSGWQLLAEIKSGSVFLQGLDVSLFCTHRKATVAICKTANRRVQEPVQCLLAWWSDVTCFYVEFAKRWRVAPLCVPHPYLIFNRMGGQIQM